LGKEKEKERRKKRPLMPSGLLKSRGKGQREDFQGRIKVGTEPIMAVKIRDGKRKEEMGAGGSDLKDGEPKKNDEGGSGIATKKDRNMLNRGTIARNRVGKREE